MLWIVEAVIEEGVESEGDPLKSKPWHSSFATAAWCNEAGEVTEEVTRTERSGAEPLHPVWNHVCLVAAPPFTAHSAALVFSVFSKPGEAVGQVVVPVEELLPHDRRGEDMSVSRAIAEGFLEGLPSLGRTGSAPNSHHNIQAELRNERGVSTGSILVRALLLQQHEAAARCTEIEYISNTWFETEETGEGVTTAGGTADFYRLRLTAEGMEMTNARAQDQFLGKNLAHAETEKYFYEESSAVLRSSNDGHGLRAILQFTCRYVGVLRTVVGRAPVEMLVMENLGCGWAENRLVDIKIGKATASRRWKGKGTLAAAKQMTADSFTNSWQQGFRLVGMSSTPASLTSLVSSIKSSTGRMDDKKIKRLVYSQLPGSLLFMFIYDLRGCCKDTEGEADPMLGDALSVEELSELTALATLQKLAKMSLACCRVKVPQKWVGSSVAVCFPLRPLPRSEPRLEEDSARVKLIDWGRSEVNDASSMFGVLSEKERTDRARHWDRYLHGMMRLSWEAARAYHNRFCASGWKRLKAQLYEVEVVAEKSVFGRCDRLLAEFDIPLQESGETGHVSPATAPGRSSCLGPTTASYDEAKLTTVVHLRGYPPESRLKESWRVRPVQLEVAACRAGKSASLYLQLMATSSEGGQCCQRSATKRCSRDRVDFNEWFELPVASEPERLKRVLNEVQAGLGDKDPLLMPPPGDDDEDAEAARHWARRVANATRSSVFWEAPHLPPAAEGAPSSDGEREESQEPDVEWGPHLAWSGEPDLRPGWRAAVEGAAQEGKHGQGI